MPITCPTSFKLRTIWVSLYLQEDGVYSLSFLVTLASTDWLRRESTYQKRKKYRLLVAGLLEAGHTTLYDLERLCGKFSHVFLIVLEGRVKLRGPWSTRMVTEGKVSRSFKRKLKEKASGEREWCSKHLH